MTVSRPSRSCKSKVVPLSGLKFTMVKCKKLQGRFDALKARHAAARQTFDNILQSRVSWGWRHKHQARSLSRRLHNSYRHAARLGRQLNVLRGTVVNLRQQLNDRNAAIVAKDQSISTANKNYSVLKALKDRIEKQLSTAKFTVDELHRNFKVQASTLATEKKHHQAQIASNQKLELINKKLVDESTVVKAFLQRHNYPWEDVLACSKKEQDFAKSVGNEQSS